MRRILDIRTLTPVRNWKWTRAVKLFLQEQADGGVILRDKEVPRALADVKALLIDATLVMEGWNAVRMAAAPLEACDLDQFRRQGSWMMLAAGVALGCDGYAPLVEFVRELNFESGRMARQYPRVEALPYDDDRRMETTVHRDAGGLRAYAKGDPESVLLRCTQVLDGRERPLTDEDRKAILESAQEMESVGLETLSFATRWVDTPGEYETEMVFLGTVGMGDLVKPDIPDAMEALRKAGVRPTLFSETALLPAAVRAGGLLREAADVLFASELESLDGSALRAAVQGADAFLGMDTAQRGRLMRALRADGPVAAILPAPDGRIYVTLGRGAVADAAIAKGALLGVAKLLMDCKALRDEHAQET